MENPPTRCPRCGAAMRVDDRLCPACMLAAGSANDSALAEEEIFQRALALEPNERRAFIQKETCGNPQLASAVELLMQGYDEAGGDDARPSLSGEPINRAQWATVPNEEPGTVFNHFRLIRLLGEGGMGSVWRAEQNAPVRRTVALKVIKLGMDTREVVKRFERERQNLALLSHPNIAQVYEAGATVLGRPYFAMELVEGQPITGYSDKAGLDIEARLKLFREVCAAVEHAHQKGVIHRDLKPSNILVANGVVKVIDFGVAKATQGAGDMVFTQIGRIIGTPAYMSPEQARTDGVDVDTRTDVYALGVILYELLTGTLPIDSSRLATAGISEMQRILEEQDPPAPSTRMSALSRRREARSETGRRVWELRGDLDRVVMKAIRKDRNERYASAAAFSEDLRRYLESEPVSATAPTAAYRVGKFIRRHRLAVTAGAAVLVALLAGLIVSLVQVRRANDALALAAKSGDEVTFTLSDMYLRSGLSAAENHDPTRAELWFANAAILGAKDPDRTAVNRLRAAAWRRDAMTPVRAFETGFEHMHRLIWNPHQPALIVQAENIPSSQVWNLDTEKLWSSPRVSAFRAATWDPSGNRIAALTTNFAVVVIEYPSGKELARLDDPNAGCMEWSPDGRLIATENFLWDWHSNEKRPLPHSTGWVRFCKDGHLILLQWDRLAAVCLTDEPGRFLFEPVTTAIGDHPEFLGSGETFEVGRDHGGLAVCNSTNGAPWICQAGDPGQGHDGFPIGTSPNGRFVARYNQSVVDLKKTNGAVSLNHITQFCSASFCPDNSLLATGAYDNRLELWSLPDGQRIGEVGHHHTGVVNVEFSPDGKCIASGEDGLVRIWRVRSPQLLKQIPTADSSLAMISADGKLVASSGFGYQTTEIKETQAVEIDTGRAVGAKIAPGGLIMDGTFGLDGSWMALAVSTTRDRTTAFEKSGGSGNVELWNFRTGLRLGEPIAMPSEPRGLCLHPSESVIGVCCAGGEGVEINLSNRIAHIVFPGHKPVNARATLNNGRCAYFANGRVFAQWGLYENVHLWDRILEREAIPPIEDDCTTFDMAYYEGTVGRAVVSSSLRLEFIDALTGAKTAPSIPYINWPFLTRFSPDGNLLLTAGGGRTAQLWDWRKGLLACPMLPHEDTIMAGCFLAGTPWVITGGDDGKIKFWDSRTGTLIRPPVKLEGMVLALQLTPNHRTLAASGILNDGIALINLDQLLAPPDLGALDARLLAEIDADAEIHPGGGVDHLTPQAWLAKWRQFRANHPDYPGQRFGP